MDDVARTPEVAGIVVGDRLGVLALVELELALFDLLGGELHAVHDFEGQFPPPLSRLHHHLHDPVCVTALTHEQNLAADLFGLFDIRLVVRLHVRIVPGEETVVGTVEIARTHGPLVLHAQDIEDFGDARGGFGIDQHVSGGRDIEILCALDVHRDLDVRPVFLLHLLFKELDGRFESLGRGAVRVPGFQRDLHDLLHGLGRQPRRLEDGPPLPGDDRVVDPERAVGGAAATPGAGVEVLGPLLQLPFPVIASSGQSSQQLAGGGAVFLVYGADKVGSFDRIVLFIRFAVIDRAHRRTGPAFGAQLHIEL